MTSVVGGESRRHLPRHPSRGQMGQGSKLIAQRTGAVKGSVSRLEGQWPIDILNSVSLNSAMPFLGTRHLNIRLCM